MTLQGANLDGAASPPKQACRQLEGVTRAEVEVGAGQSMGCYSAAVGME
jgi:hypothetical protein